MVRRRAIEEPEQGGMFEPDPGPGYNIGTIFTPPDPVVIPPNDPYVPGPVEPPDNPIVNPPNDPWAYGPQEPVIPLTPTPVPAPSPVPEPALTAPDPFVTALSLGGAKPSNPNSTFTGTAVPAGGGTAAPSGGSTATSAATTVQPFSSFLTGGGTPTAIITAMYQYFYGRPPTAAELSAQLPSVTQQGQSALSQIYANLNTDADVLDLGPYGSSAGVSSAFTPNYTIPPPPGWDATKWADPSHQTVKYRAGHFMMSQPPTAAGMAAVANYLTSLGYTVNYSGTGDTMVLSGLDIGPTPITVDMIQNIDAVGGPAQWQWGDWGVPSTGAGGTGGTSGTGGTGGTGNTSGGGVGGGGVNTIQPVNNPGTGSTMTPLTGFEGNVGQDPLSQAITAGLMQLLTSGGHIGGADNEALNLENARQAADRARKAHMAGIMSQLANRGLLPENAPGGYGGLALDALSRLETNEIGPLYWDAIRDYMLQDQSQANQNYMSALELGTNRQNVLARIALDTLAQNASFNQFLATFGLNADEALAGLASGQDTALISLLTAWLQAANTSAGGQV